MPAAPRQPVEQRRQERVMERVVFRMVYGLAALLGVGALVLLFQGKWGGFFGMGVMSLGFAGFAWAGTLIICPPLDRKPLPVAKVIGVMFGGAGVVMLVGAGALLSEGELGGGIGLGVFGLVFCTGAYLGHRAFAIPPDMKEVRVAETTKVVEDGFGRRREITASRSVLVDASTPAAEIEAQQREWAEKPWTQRADWAEGRVIQDGIQSIRTLAIFTVVWNVIADGIAGTLFWDRWESGDVPWLLLVFPAAGLVLVAITVRTWLHRRKFGTSVLRLEGVPVWLGDRLRGVVETGVRVGGEPGRDFTVRLVCVRRHTTTDSDRRESVSEERLWEHEERVRGQVGGATFHVPVSIALPADRPASELQPEDDRTVWRLRVACSLPGLDYAVVFEVPVFGREV